MPGSNIQLKPPHTQHDAEPLYNPHSDTPAPQVTAPGPGTPHEMQFYAAALTEQLESGVREGAPLGPQNSWALAMSPALHCLFSPGFHVLRRLWLSHALDRQNSTCKALLLFPCLTSRTGGKRGRRTACLQRHRAMPCCSPAEQQAASRP